MKGGICKVEKVRTVIVGFGGMGSQYADIIYHQSVKGMVLSGICCRNLQRQKLIQEKYPLADIYENTTDMFNQAAEFDAIIIATPHNTHVEIGKKAFELGKHVMVDKPSGIHIKEVEELNDAAQAAGTGFGIMFNIRTKDAFRKAKKIIDSGRSGQITRAVWVCNNWLRTTCYHKSEPWRSTWRGEQGGLLMNQCQHNLDIWQWLLGMPDRVNSAVDFGKYNDFAVDDSADIRFEYHNGLRGTFISSSGENPGVDRLEIWGTKGRIVIENGETVFFEENKMSTTDFAKINTEIYGKLEYQRQEITIKKEFGSYQEMLQNFTNHILYGEALIAPGEEGLKSVELANAAYLSAWLKKDIELPMDEELYVRKLEETINKEKEQS